MATITITIPDPVAQRVITAVSEYFGYAAQIPDPATGGSIPNPETRAQFSQRMIRDYLKTIVKNYEAGIAAGASQTKTENEIVLI